MSNLEVIAAATWAAVGATCTALVVLIFTGTNLIAEGRAWRKRMRERNEWPRRATVEMPPRPKPVEDEGPKVVAIEGTAVPLPAGRVGLVMSSTNELRTILLSLPREEAQRFGRTILLASSSMLPDGGRAGVLGHIMDGGSPVVVVGVPCVGVCGVLDVCGGGGGQRANQAPAH